MTSSGETSSGDLTGARVLITREADRAEALVQLIAQRGGDCLVAPLTAIRPPADLAGLERAAARVDEFDWLLFTSARGVEGFFDRLDRLPRGRVACIGPATARALTERGVTEPVVSPRAEGGHLAAAMRAAAGGDLSGARILFPRAAEGREEAAVALRGHGASVELVVAYETVVAAAEEPAVAAALAALRRREVDVLVLFAPSQVRAAIELLGAGGAQLLSACRLVAAIGPTTAAALSTAGVRVDLVPPSPRPEVLASLIGERYSGKSETAQ